MRHKDIQQIFIIKSLLNNATSENSKILTTEILTITRDGDNCLGLQSKPWLSQVEKVDTQTQNYRLTIT